MEKDQAVVADFAAEAALGLEKCTRQYVPTVARNVKYHSSQLKESQFTAGTATRNTRSSK